MNIVDTPDRLLAPADLSKLTGWSVQTLANKRCRREGPPYLVLGRRTVRYSASAVQAWIASNTVSTCNTAK